MIENDFQAAANSTYDPCFTPGLGSFGITSGDHCDANYPTAFFTPNNGEAAFYTPDSVAVGPNTGLHYVLTAAVSMTLFKQLLRDLRSDGATYSIDANTRTDVRNGCYNRYGNYNARNWLTVNKECTSNSSSWDSFVNHIWDHEEFHADTIQFYAATSSGDVPLRLERTVEGSADNLSDVAFSIYSGAQLLLFNKTVAIEDPANPTTREIYNARSQYNYVWRLDSLASAGPP